MENQINKFLYWTPRVLAIVMVLFLMLFSLDVFNEGQNFWGTSLAFFMHNIPALVLLAVLFVSWKYEIVGGIGFILAGFFYIYLVLSGGFEWFKISWILTIFGPAFIVGILFLIGWFNKKK